jgi:hypothetical protein
MPSIIASEQVLGKRALCLSPRLAVAFLALLEQNDTKAFSKIRCAEPDLC